MPVKKSDNGKQTGKPVRRSTGLGNRGAGLGLRRVKKNITTKRG